MGVSESNANGAGWSSAANKDSTSLQTRSAKNGLQQFFGGSDTDAGVLVPSGDVASGAAALIGLGGKGGGKGEQAATDSKASKKPDANVDTVQSDPVDEKIAAVKEQIADLLDTIEALMPGFSKDVQPRVKMNAAAAKTTDAAAETTDKEVIKAALEELAQMLEEIIGLLKGQDDSDKPGDTEATPSNYAVDKDTAQNAKEQTGAEAVDAFMSIFDQLSDGTKTEVAEILAAMALEGESKPTSSNGSVEGDSSEIYTEFIDLVAERSGTETTPILNIDIAGIEVRVGDGEGLAIIEEPVLIDGKNVPDGAIIEAGDSVTLTDGRVLTLDGYNTITVEDPKTGMGEAVTWESTIPIDSELADSGSTQQNGDGGADAAAGQAGGGDTAQAGDSGADTSQTSSNTTRSGTAESGAGQSARSSDSPGTDGQSGADAAASTGTGNDATGDGTASQSDTDTEAGAGSSGGSTDTGGSVGGADTDSSSQGTRLDQIGVNGYYRDGVLTVEEPVVIGGQTQNGAELKPGDQVTLANGNLLIFNADGASCYLHNMSADYGSGMPLG